MDAEPKYCFGVSPGGAFLVRDHLATFQVLNFGDKLIRVEVEILESVSETHEQRPGSGR